MRVFGAKNTQSGVTLVETMMAILVFGIVLVAMLDATAQSLVAGKRSDFAYQAYNIAKNRIETLKSMSFSSIQYAEEEDTLVDSNGVSDLDGAFARTTDITTSYTGDADLVSVTVSVDYQVKGVFVGRPMSITTVIYNGG